MSHYICISILVSGKTEGTNNKTETHRCSLYLLKLYEPWRNSYSYQQLLLYNASMWIMCISAASPKQTKLCKSSLNAVILVPSEQGQTCPLCLPEATVHMIWLTWCRMPSHPVTSKVMWSNCKYITVTRQNGTVALLIPKDKPLMSLSLRLRKQCRIIF